MKKLIIPLLTAAVVISIMFAGCARPAPVPTPTPQEPEITEWGLPLNPYAGLAVKPDGTPYHFHHSIVHLMGDWCQNCDKIMDSYVTRAGGKYTVFDAQVNVDRQVDSIADMIAVAPPDAFIIQCVDELMLAAPIDNVAAAGIPVFNYDLIAPTDASVTRVIHDFDGPFGSNVVGQHFVDIAEAENRQINIFEIWGMRSSLTCQDRHAGFHNAVDKCPLITVRESADSMWAEEQCASLSQDAFTAYPELNAIYVHGGGARGSVEGLRAVGRLYPVGDPDHVVFCNNDTDCVIAAAMDEGWCDAFGSHQSWDLADVTIKLAFINIILGQPIPKDVNIPMSLVTSENIDTLRVFGCPIYPRMPAGEWDKWPPLDSSEIGIETPTVAMRKELQGY